MNKIFDKDKEFLEKKKKNIIILSIVVSSLVLVCLILLMIFLDRTNKTILLTISLVIYILFALFISFVVFMVLPSIKNYLCEQEKGNCELLIKTGKVVEISKDDFARKKLIFKRIKLLVDKKEVDLEILNDKSEYFEVGKIYKIGIKGATLYTYEEEK